MATIPIGQLIQSSISGYSGYSGFSGGGGATITNDTTTANNAYYPAMAFNQTTGTLSSSYVSSTKLYFNPSTGTLNATVLNSLSDKQLKKEIQSIEDAVNTILKLDGVSFLWKDNDRKSYGVIAQDLEKIIPELVDGDTAKSVNYSGLIGFLLNAVKELDARIKILENKNNP